MQSFIHYLREKIVLFSHLVQHLMCLYGRFQISSQNLKDILIYDYEFFVLFPLQRVVTRV